MTFRRYTFNIIIILALVLVLGIPGQISFAADGSKPSAWAEAEIKASIEKQLVPTVLQGNYQNNIKRYQYVLLALEIFDISGKIVDITEGVPFSDAIDHPYEKEIVKAYNAGIVKGDGKGSFHPDNYITREEIASLVVNLLKQISPNRDFTLKKTYQYNDRNKISDWASYYIDYCYENKILNGYNGNVMDPKGNATIEQSIALLYRLANSENLLKKDYSLRLSDGSIADVKIVQQFTENYDENTLNVLNTLSKDNNIGIMELWENGAALTVNDNSINLNNPYFEKNLFAIINDAGDPLFTSAFKQLLATYTTDSKAFHIFDENIAKMKNNEELNEYIQISDTDYFKIRSLGYIGSRMSYKIFFIIDKE